MQTYRVWAPKPAKVELQLGDRRLPMKSGSDGWWVAEVPVTPGADYGFVLDGNGPFPDPRSRCQPAGVHRLSRWVEHSSFKWSDANFQAPELAKSLIYELHVGTFSPEGTFLSAIEKLGHLASLGVTHVELMPLAAFDGKFGWGYDGVSLYAPHAAYGEPDDLKRLVDACHRRGLAVLLDVVYNHFGPSGNYLPQYGPYFTTRYFTPWGSAVNYDDAESDEVRRYFCDNALMWLRDFHFDGLRLDAIHAIMDISAIPFLEQLSDEVKQLQAQIGKRLVLLAESDLNAPRVLWPGERGGYGFDAQWSDDFHHALHAILTGERNGYYADFGSMADLAKAWKQAFVRDGIYSPSRRCRMGRRPVGLGGDRFLAYLQNHDQVGNRARGERSSALMNPGRLKIGAALVLLSPFVPMLFQGEEWGASTPFLYFADHEDLNLATAVREGRQREFAGFGWNAADIPDPGATATFQRSKLDWSELGRASHAELLAWHKDLICLRREEPALHPGPLGSGQANFDEDARWLCFERGPISLACNLGEQSQCVPLRKGPPQLLLHWGPRPELGQSQALLAPDSLAVLKF